METINSSKRIDYIEWIQFVGIICVIFGHSMNDVAVPNAIYQVKAWIYTFHMPLFFLVSAYLFAYKGGFKRNGYKNFFTSKFMRLLLPYILWNVAFIGPKIIMAPYTNDQVELTPEYFGMLVLYPKDNILGHTWFLCALFEMFVLAIGFDKLREKRQLWIPVLAVLVVVNCFGVSDRFLAIGDLMKNSVYFWIGLILGSISLDNVRRWGRDLYVVLAFLLVVLGFTTVWAFNDKMLINTLALGMSVISLLGILQIRYKIKFPLMEFVSRNLFCIYILHWPILMVIRFIIYQKIHLNPILTMCIMFLGGIALSLFSVYILRKFKSPFMKGVCKIVFGM